jgi:hypothetical protein
MRNAIVRPQWIATAIVDRMLTRWMITEKPPDPPHSTPGK